ncbi:glycosyltransferase family 2 protein [Rhizomonospora bruguierae]|uniref:glycosyltransferase family 2 protein n=1 Tax=Rhizomonospora bruguierae TaxID=1581705 RepID=UPI001BCB269D|nr:glycosyltransferase family 2 protein [Micromonospora sp. NBRC 107566]
MTGRPTASVIIVSYNTRELTLRCLDALHSGRTGAVDFDIIVVDNASHDGSADAIAQHHPSVTLMRLAENVGWGRGANRGAMASDADYLLLLNPDTVPVGDVVADLVTFAHRHPEHRLYTGRTLRADGTDDGYSCWGLPSLWSCFTYASGLSTIVKNKRWANPEGLPGYDRHTVREVPAISGCLMMVERALFVELGGFDPRFFLYSEDMDLSRRARDLGARPVLHPDAAVVHVVGASSSSVGQRVKILRGKSTYLRRHFSPARARLGRALLAAGVGLRALASAAGAGRPGVDWPAIWRERHTWLAGWPPVDEPRPAPAIPARRAAQYE